MNNAVEQDKPYNRIRDKLKLSSLTCKIHSYDTGDQQLALTECHLLIIPYKSLCSASRNTEIIIIFL